MTKETCLCFVEERGKKTAYFVVSPHCRYVTIIVRVVELKRLCCLPGIVFVTRDA